MREEEQHNNNNRQDGSHAQQGEGHEQECSALQEVCARLVEDHRARGTHDALEPQRSHREAARGAESGGRARVRAPVGLSLGARGGNKRAR